jgi:hypothetical protein
MNIEHTRAIEAVSTQEYKIDEYTDVVLNHSIDCIRNIISEYRQSGSNSKRARRAIALCLFTIADVVSDLYNELENVWGEHEASIMLSSRKEVYVMIYIMKLIDCKYEDKEAYPFDVIHDLGLHSNFGSLDDAHAYVLNRGGFCIEDVIGDCSILQGCLNA